MGSVHSNGGNDTISTTLFNFGNYCYPINNLWLIKIFSSLYTFIKARKAVSEIRLVNCGRKVFCGVRKSIDFAIWFLLVLGSEESKRCCNRGFVTR